MNPGIDSITLRKIALQVLILLGFLFGAVVWSQRPEGALVWLTGMLTLPATWTLIKLSGALPGPERPDARRRVYNSLVGAGLLLTGALGVVMAAALETVPEDWSTRFGMLASALVLIVMGNGMPKKIEPGCSQTRGPTIQRLLGWTFVVTGLIGLVIWVVTPIAFARIAGLTLYGAAVLFAIMAVLRIRRRTRPG